MEERLRLKRRVPRLHFFENVAYGGQLGRKSTEEVGKGGVLLNFGRSPARAVERVSVALTDFQSLFCYVLEWVARGGNQLLGPLLDFQRDNESLKEDAG